MVKLTPGMKQYVDVKNANPDCIILFRMGDFYETFFEDAKVVARELDITLTARGKGESRAPLAGIPYHAVEPYVAKLIKKGYKVGIVEQTEDPKKAKGLVKRDLVRIITPGTVVESMILDQGKNNYILSFYKEDGKFALSFCDISTGEFLSGEMKKEKFFNEVRRLEPSEIIFPMSLEDSEIIDSFRKENFVLNSYDDRFFYHEKANGTLKDHFKVIGMDGFGIKSEVAISSAGALLSYIKETQKTSLDHINRIRKYSVEDYMYLDSSTIRNLELLRNIISHNSDSSLLSVVDRTTTPMGKRLMKKWIVSPLINRPEIEERLNAVEELKGDMILRSGIKEILDDICDIERLIGRVSYGNANPKDLVSLKDSLKMIPKLRSFTNHAKSAGLKRVLDVPDVSGAEKMISLAIKDEPNTIVREGNVIRKGYNSELDELRSITHNAKNYLAELEKKEKERTGIKSLKIKYNKVFGYFIEVTKSNLHLVPGEYIRRQTQVNSERFITEELKEKESKILGAQERIYELEYELFINVLEDLKQFINDIQDISEKVSEIDTLLSFAGVAEKNNYCKPVLNSEGVLDIKEGRHPVVEALSGVDFINNSCYLDNDNRTMIITGPNMSGKSTYLRQVVIICLLAQMGSFVPAKSAKVPVIDRVFSRIGAYDDLVHGQSTFMVEMNETANILNNATKHSLIVLDEIGRGTSTFDGVSLAWSIAEYLNNKIKAKTLFATHYHHLNKMESVFSGVKNYNISVEESEGKIVFLRKIVEGGTDKSYGIEVARLAGLPKEVIESSKKVMELIELEDKIGDKIKNEFRSDEIQKMKDNKDKDKMTLRKFLK